jgi:surface polysaccharide O-acyltransferase-like enzyme
MVSGYLLLRKEEPYGDFFRKRALKVFVPFLVWSVIYLLWKGEGFNQPFSIKIVVSYILKIVRGPRENHLWFFYALIGLYLFTPILRVFVAKASLCNLYYFCELFYKAHDSIKPKIATINPKCRNRLVVARKLPGKIN